MANSFLTADLGSAQAIDLIALLHSNASGTATWQIRGATSEANLTAAPGYDSGAITLWPATGLEDWDFVHGIHFIAAAQSFQWWRVDVNDASNADGHIQAGRLYIAAAWQPTDNMIFGAAIGWQDFAPKRRSLGNQIYPIQRTPARVFDLTLDLLTETEMFANGFTLDRLRGTARDILLIRDPDAAAQVQNQTVYGLFSELPPVVFAEFDAFEKRFRIEEMLP